MSMFATLSALIDRRPLLATVFLWASACLAMAVSSPHLVNGRFPDVDDALRLVQVRDLIAGQGWFDLYQYRMNPPEGTLMHWSRLVDAPLAALIWVLTLVLPQASAEYVVCFAMPLLVLLATMSFVASLARERFGGRIALLAVFAFVLTPMVPGQFQPLRIDHHSWQVLSVAIAVWGIFRPDTARGALIAGLAMAAGLMISLETIVLAAGFAIVLALRWLEDPRQSVWLARYLQVLAAGLAGLFALTRGTVDLAPHCDVIAPAHVGFFTIVAAGTSVLATRARLHPLAVLAGLAASGLAGIALVGWAAPACLAPPFAGLDPLVHKHWYLRVSEGLPLWHRDFDEAFPAALQCLFALGVAAFAALRGETKNRRWWRDYALVLAVATLAAFVTYRSIAFAGMLATVPFGWFAGRMFERWQASKRLTPKLSVAAALYAAFLPGALIATVSPWFAALSPVQEKATIPSTCKIEHNGAKLNIVAPAKVFAHLDISPGVLAYSHHSVVASGHHRSESAMRAVIAAFTSRPNVAYDMILETGSDYLVACVDLQEMTLYAQSGGQDSLAALLIRGETPMWLEPMSLRSTGGLRFWKIVKQQASLDRLD
jgi:hypothetical protein